MLSLSPLVASVRYAQMQARARATADALVLAVVSGLTAATIVLAVAIVRIA
jgi:hypothetical protein